MTNVYLMNSDEEAIVDFVKDHKELYKTDEGTTLSTRQERNVSWRPLPTVSSCQTVQDLVLIPKDLLWQTHTIQVWSNSKRNNRKVKLD